MPKLSEALVNRLVIAAVATGFLILIGLGAAAAYTLQQNLDFTFWVSHTHQVEEAVENYRTLSERLEASRRGFLLSPDAEFRDAYQATAAQMTPTIDRFEALTRDNPHEQARAAELRRLLAIQIAAGRDTFSRPQAMAGTAAFDTDPGVRALQRIRELTRQAEAEETGLLARRDQDRRASIRNLDAFAVAAGLLLLLVGVGSVVVILRYTADLTASRAELEVMNAGLEAAVAARTAELRRANEEIQRFAYIVSHDLRSPLVNVMGFTSELDAAAKPLTAFLERAEAEAPQTVTDAARRAVREDLPESISFIRTSTQKMDRLINAILQLSRQGRRVLAPERLDVQAMLHGIADSLKHRVDELGGRIEVAAGAPPVVSDRLALEQVFSNLIENALKYRRPGQPPEVVIRGRRERGRVIYEVSDNGRGVDPKDHERIFELFRRAGAQDQPGEGIGLAHVRALVYRLGGVISVDSRLDHGATFRISLPEQLSAEGAQA